MLGRESLRVAITGAASLRGKDLKRWVEESGFPAGEIRLLDEESDAGTLTELGGEAAVIQAVDETSFERTRFVFFTGSGRFAAQRTPAAERAGATVIDLTGGLAASPGARRWIPRLGALLPAPAPSPGAGGRRNLFLSPSAPAIVACSLSAALSKFPLTRLALVFFHPVSERGQAGIDELESQTGKLLSMQPVRQEVFDAQVAFNLLDRWGADSPQRLSDVRSALAQEVRGYLADRVPLPAMTLVQAPVFYAHAFSGYAELSAPQNPDSFTEQLAAAGFAMVGENDPGPSNVSVAGQPHPVMGRPERDSNADCGYWFWGAADNLRLASANAIRIAECLLAN